MSRRGHTLILIVMVMAMLATAAVVFASRHSLDLNDRHADYVRTQALWLARSALTAGVTGTHDVQTGNGPARVRVQRQADVVSVTVELAGATATVVNDPYGEQFSAGE